MSKLRGYRDSLSGKFIVNCASFVECPLCYRCRGGGFMVRCSNCIAFGCRHSEREISAMIRQRPSISISEV